MLDIKIIRNENEWPEGLSKEKAVDFLHEHLDQFGDSKEAIGLCIDYAFSKDAGRGGFITAGYWEGDLCGIVIMNNTGMANYIPEWLLVYIAVDSTFRNKGIGGKLVNHAIDNTEGDVALHVEYENPAKRLYERVGFTSKYAEMRYKKG